MRETKIAYSLEEARVLFTVNPDIAVDCRVVDLDIPHKVIRSLKCLYLGEAEAFFSNKNHSKLALDGHAYEYIEACGWHSNEMILRVCSWPFYTVEIPNIRFYKLKFGIRVRKNIRLIWKTDCVHLFGDIDKKVADRVIETIKKYRKTLNE